MPGPVAALALVTLGSGLALGGMSYKRAKDAKKNDKYPELTNALANNHDKVKSPAPTKSRSTSRKAKTTAQKRATASTTQVA